jgi:hypothetical protein
MRNALLAVRDYFADLRAHPHKILLLLLRVILAPLAVLLLFVGWLLGHLWEGFGMLSLVGLWLLGVQIVIG